MKGQIRFFTLKGFILAAALLFGSIAVPAKNSDVAAAKAISEQTISVIAANLSKRLRADLADDAATVKINDIQREQLSKNTIDFKGTAHCLLGNKVSQLPIRFEAKINPQTQNISDINYTFIEETAEYAPTTTEELLMKELMKKVSADYKTDSIVIAIDGFEIVQSADGKTYQGIGEIKIGEVEWSKINFDVVLDAANKAAKIKYDIK